MIKCNEGYKRQGSAYVKCSGTSWFPTKLPSCNKKECRAQPSPPNGVVSPSHEVQSKEKVYYGSTLEYSCNDCYHLQGAQVRKCMSDNKDSVVWSVVEPSCAKVKCTLPAIMNGTSYILYHLMSNYLASLHKSWRKILIRYEHFRDSKRWQILAIWQTGLFNHRSNIGISILLQAKCQMGTLTVIPLVVEMLCNFNA